MLALIRIQLKDMNANPDQCFGSGFTDSGSRLNTDPDPGFDDQKLKKNYS